MLITLTTTLSSPVALLFFVYFEASSISSSVISDINFYPWLIPPLLDVTISSLDDFDFCTAVGRTLKWFLIYFLSVSLYFPASNTIYLLFYTIQFFVQYLHIFVIFYSF